ncbi:MAG TPA: hypothetical protein VIQ24_04680 [Pyrinomonadaceae bacterium]
MKAAVTGGALAGILSAIPFVNFVNVCCCAWAILGGLLAAHLYAKNAQTPVTPADGATLGAIAGAITAAIYLVIGVPLGYMMGKSISSFALDLVSRNDPAQAEALRQQMEASQTIGSAIVNGLIAAVLLFIFSTLGGLLGAAIFGKKGAGGGGSTMPPPPPPVNYGGTQPPAGGSYGGGTYGTGS